MDGYRFQAQITRVSPVGVVADGLRVNLGFDGTVGSGPMAGRRLDGTCYLRVRADGVGVIDARELVTGEPGEVVSIEVGGYVVPPAGLPDLPVLADPAFRWPDLELPMHGWTRTQTAAAELNRTVFGFTGAVNMGRGTLVVEAQPLAAGAAAALIGAGYAVFAAGEVPRVLEGMAPDVTWVEPGDNPVAGTYKGRHEVAGFFEELARRSAGSFRIEVHDVVAAGDRVVALVTEHAGGSLAAPAVHVWRIAEGGVVAFQNHYADQAAADRFWRATT